MNMTKNNTIIKSKGFPILAAACIFSLLSFCMVEFTYGSTMNHVKDTQLIAVHTLKNIKQPHSSESFFIVNKTKTQSQIYHFSGHLYTTDALKLNLCSWNIPLSSYYQNSFINELYTAKKSRGPPQTKVYLYYSHFLSTFVYPALLLAQINVVNHCTIDFILSLAFFSFFCFSILFFLSIQCRFSDLQILRRPIFSNSNFNSFNHINTTNIQTKIKR